MKDLYSRTIQVTTADETTPESAVQVTEYVKDRLLATISYIGPNDQVFKKELMLTEDEAFALSALLNEWTDKRTH